MFEECFKSALEGSGLQMQAVNSCLQAQKTQYLQRIREWQASLKYYDEAVKLDILRLSLLKDVAGINAGTPEVSFSAKCTHPGLVAGSCTVAHSYSGGKEILVHRGSMGLSQSAKKNLYAGTLSFETLHENSSHGGGDSGHSEECTGENVRARSRNSKEE